MSMAERHSDVCDSGDIVPYAEKFEDVDSKVNDGLFWCTACERELVSRRMDRGEVFVF